MGRYASGEGPEQLDPTPKEMPAGCFRPKSLQEMMAEMLREHIEASKYEEEGFETYEEANDFEEEDPDILEMSPYTLLEAPEEPIMPKEPPPQEVEKTLAQEALKPPQENQSAETPDEAG